MFIGEKYNKEQVLILTSWQTNIDIRNSVNTFACVDDTVTVVFLNMWPHFVNVCWYLDFSAQDCS